MNFTRDMPYPKCLLHQVLLILKRFLLIFKNKQRSAAYSLFVRIHDVTVCPMRCLKAMPKVL